MLAGSRSRSLNHPGPRLVLLCLRHKNVRSTHREHSPLSLPQMPLMDDAPAHSSTCPPTHPLSQAGRQALNGHFTPVLEGENKNTKTCNLYGIHQWQEQQEQQPTKVDADVGQKEAARVLRVLRAPELRAQSCELRALSSEL